MSGSPGPWRAVAQRAAGLLLLVASAAVLTDRATSGVSLTRSLATGPSTAGTGPWWVVVAAVALLSATGALPAWRLVGARPLALFLAPCLGALVAGVSAVVTVVAASEPLRWYVAFAAAANAAALASTAARQERPRVRSRIGTVAAVVAVVAAAGFGISDLGRTAPAPVARATWMALAPVLVRGHRAVAAAVTSSATAVHLFASPLGAGCSAVTWLVTGVRSSPAAMSVLAIVTAAAVGAAACAIAEAGSAVADGTSGATAMLVRAAGVLASAGWCLAAVGVAGRQAVSGDLTLLWTAVVVAAAVLTLILPPTGWRLRTAAVLGAAAVLTAPEGTVAVAVLVVLVGLRRLFGAQATARRARRLIDLVGSMVALAAVVAWPAGAVASGVGPPSTRLPPGGVWHRVQATWHVAGSRLWPAAVAAAVVLVGTVVLGRRRRASGLASDLGPIAVAVVVFGVLVAAAGWDTAAALPVRLEPLGLATALPLVLAAGLMAVWVPVGLAALLVPSVSGRLDAGAGPAGRATPAGGWTATGEWRPTAGPATPADGPAAAPGEGPAAAPGEGPAAAPGEGPAAPPADGLGGAPVPDQAGSPPARTGAAEVDGRGTHVLHPSP